MVWVMVDRTKCIRVETIIVNLCIFILKKIYWQCQEICVRVYVFVYVWMLRLIWFVVHVLYLVWISYIFGFITLQNVYACKPTYSTTVNSTLTTYHSWCVFLPFSYHFTCFRSVWWIFPSKFMHSTSMSICFHLIFQSVLRYE